MKSLTIIDTTLRVRLSFLRDNSLPSLSEVGNFKPDMECQCPIFGAINLLIAMTKTQPKADVMS